MREEYGQNGFGQGCLLARRLLENDVRFVEGKVSVPDFNATIAYALGLPTDLVVHSPSGRPFTVAHKGQPVLEMFG